MSAEERKNATPRTVMLGGKAFATYTNAKRIVKLVNDVGAVINTDPEVNSYLKVIYLHFIFQITLEVRYHIQAEIHFLRAKMSHLKC